MRVVELCQVVAEVGEVVADTDPEVAADIAVHTRQPTLPATTITHVQQAVLQQAMPLVVQVIAQLRGTEVRR